MSDATARIEPANLRSVRGRDDEQPPGGVEAGRIGLRTESSADVSAAAISPGELEAFGNELIAALKTVYDPEIPVDIYELGLIYKLDVSDNRDVTVDMTLTAPGCPVAGEMPNMVRNALQGVPGVGEVTVNMTFDPPWTPDRMSEEAKLELNMF